MIHWRNEGQHFKIGLNVMFARGHLSVCWVSYDFAEQEGSCRGWDLSRRGLKRRTARWNVVHNYLAVRELSVINTEVLQDLLEEQRVFMRGTDRTALIRPRRYH